MNLTKTEADMADAIGVLMDNLSPVEMILLMAEGLRAFPAEEREAEAARLAARAADIHRRLHEQVVSEGGGAVVLMATGLVGEA